VRPPGAAAQARARRPPRAARHPGGRTSGVMPPGWPAHEEPAPGLPYGAGGRNSFLATETALRDRKRKLMPNGLNRESAIRLEGYSQRGPGGPQESGPAAGCQGTIQAGPRPQPQGRAFPSCRLTWLFAGPPPLRTRPVRARAAPGASHEPFCPVAARLRVTRGRRGWRGRLSPAGRSRDNRPQQGHPAIFRRTVMRPRLGPVRLFPDWRRRPAKKAPAHKAD
jgi:hypothetical protein